MTGFLGSVLALLIAALGAAAAWDRALLRSSGSVRAIEFQASGAASAIRANGDRAEVRAVRGIGVTRHWVALAPASFGGRGLLLPTGMLGAENARVLRLWALWGRLGAVVPGQRRT